MTTERVSGRSGSGRRAGGAGEWTGGAGEPTNGSRTSGAGERMRGAGEWTGGAGERIEGAGAVTDGEEREIPAEIPTEAPGEISAERRPRAGVRVMPLWARPLAEPEEPGWSLAARRPATARSLEGVGV
ncbi:hypothetical protein ACIGMX_10645 [Streptomyces aquilus]|uniref:hypothetical protein n=1 Tax=Streptomyces aquilus TaxID=2548456 RepID=UPI0037D48547